MKPCRNTRGRLRCVGRFSKGKRRKALQALTHAEEQAKCKPGRVIYSRA